MTREVDARGAGLVLQLVFAKSRNDGAAGDPSSPTDSGESVQRLAGAMRDARMQRQRHFNAALFSDPAWDILLDLFLAECEGRKLSVTGAAYSADIPPTTALRWISALEQEGLVRRQNDPLDKRRTHVQLTYSGLRTMRQYFESCESRAHAAMGQYALSPVLTDSSLRTGSD